MSSLAAVGTSVPLVQSSLVIVTLYLGSGLNAGIITSTPTLNMGSDFEDASRYYCDLYWDVGKINIPVSGDDAQLTSHHLVPLGPVEGGK